MAILERDDADCLYTPFQFHNPGDPKMKLAEMAGLVKNKHLVWGKGMGYGRYHDDAKASKMSPNWLEIVAYNMCVNLWCFILRNMWGQQEYRWIEEELYLVVDNLIKQVRKRSDHERTDAAVFMIKSNVYLDGDDAKAFMTWFENTYADKFNHTSYPGRPFVELYHRKLVGEYNKRLQRCTHMFEDNISAEVYESDMTKFLNCGLPTYLFVDGKMLKYGVFLAFDPWIKNFRLDNKERKKIEKLLANKYNASEERQLCNESGSSSSSSTSSSSSSVVATDDSDDDDDLGPPPPSDDPGPPPPSDDDDPGTSPHSDDDHPGAPDPVVSDGAPSSATSRSRSPYSSRSSSSSGDSLSSYECYLIYKNKNNEHPSIYL